MKNSNYIVDSVFNVKLNYEQMQNETEKIFFQCLEEGRDVEYFTEHIAKIWENIDHSYMDDEIEKYREIIHEQIMGKKEILVKNENDIFALVPVLVLIRTEKFFRKVKTKEYNNSISHIEKLKTQEAKDEYIKLKLGKYTSNTVLYKAHTPNGHDRLVSPAVYNSMIYNTNLVREGWNQTMEDADKVNAKYFIIPYHSFSCEHCLPYQQRLLTRNEIIEIAGRADEAEGDILHPNCKCEITIWKENEPIPRSNLSEEQKKKAADIRQKVNGLTLQKERIKTKMDIAEKYGYIDQYDKYNQQRNKINKTIRELKKELPTEELRKQVVAINR